MYIFYSKTNDLPAPPGYNPSVMVNYTEVVRDQHLVMKKSWDLALGPLKQVSTVDVNFIYVIEF